jgi:RimJ/RimL family protein N-acetyltransferase
MRVFMRPIERTDLEWLLTQRNDSRNFVMFNQPVPLSMDEQLSWYENQVLTRKTVANMAYLDKIRIGYGALQNINWITRSAEISHFIIPEVNPDLALYVHDCLLYIAFNCLNLNRIHSICFNHNGIFEKLKILGFKSEGTLRESCFKEGNYGDSQMISVLKNEWVRLTDALVRGNGK